MQSKAAKSFRARHVPDKAYRPFSDEDRSRLAGRLPAPMVDLLEKDGWCSYDQQAIWLCDPDEWRETARTWLPKGSKAFDVLLRSGFGDLLAWNGKTFWLILPHELTRISQTDDPDWLFSATLKADDFHFNDPVQDAMKQARETCGPLTWKQMYNYAPALALGGDLEESELAVEDARVALDILSQLGEIQTVDI